jgi:hypothetical protein
MFEGLECWYHRWEGFLKYVDETDSGGMTYIPSLMASRGRRVVSSIPFRRPEGNGLVFKVPL